MPQTVGVIALQGDYAKHLEAIGRVNPRVRAIEVRTPEELAQCERAILPGGESTTVGLLMQRFGLGDALKQAAGRGMPIWGTCMGMIIMAKEISGSSQYSLGLLDITVERNAFGAQVHSFEDEVRFEPLGEEVTGVFIRAPVVAKLGEDVEILSRYQDKIVGVRQGNIVGTSFHPELTDDTKVHKWFLSLKSPYRPTS